MRCEPRFRIEPAGIKGTQGQDAYELMCEYGFVLDDWQRAVLDAWLSWDPSTGPTYLSCGVSCPRQNGKNGIIEAREFFGMLINGDRILHTAHIVRTAKRSFKRLKALFTDRRFPDIMAEVVEIRNTNGEEAIELRNGARIEFSSRAKGTARGFDGVSLVIYDEAQALSDEHIEAITPTLSASVTGERQVIYAGTPPTPVYPAEVFRRVREDCLKNNPTASCWHEWSVAEIGDVADKKRWYATNPALGIRLEERFVEVEELAHMSSDGFARERLGWWSPVGSSKAAIDDYEKWEACATSEPLKDGIPSYAVKFSPDGSIGVLAVCLAPDKYDSKHPEKNKERPHVEIVQVYSMSAGVSAMAEWLIERKSKCAQLTVDGMAWTQALVAKLNEARFPKPALKLPASKDVAAACSMLADAVNMAQVEDGRRVASGGLTHFGQEPLDQAIKLCPKRRIGSGGGWGFGEKEGSGAEPAVAEAAALAYWGAMTTKRRPNRRSKLL